MALRARAFAGAAALAGLVLAGCQNAAQQEAAFRAALAESCRAQGFAEGTDAYRLCLLLERNDARLSLVERRLDHLEFELRRIDQLGLGCRRCF